MTAAVTLPRIDVPDARDWWPALGAFLSTGRAARDIAWRIPAGAVVALDSETMSVTDSFTVKCVTAAWDGPAGTEAVLLDVIRRPDDLAAAAALCARAGELVLHSSDFDIPGLHIAGVLTLADISKVTDTLIYARAAWPDDHVPKTLGKLGPRLLGIPTMDDGLSIAIRAAGYRSVAEWYAKGDLDKPFYRFMAMADTVVTLRLLEPLRAAAQDQQLDHPFHAHGARTRAEAAEIVEVPQRANRVTLRRAARGLEVDLDYVDRYRERVDIEIARNSALLTENGIRPGNGLDMVTALDELGLIPDAWPRTDKTNRLSSDKKNLDLLDHPLALAHLAVAEANHTLNYLDAVVARSAVTGRLHPQYAILGASTTGRMSMKNPPLQQFSEDARPIVLADSGRSLTSVDWSSIEPALLAWSSGDLGFITPFERGADLYEPIQLACGIVRKDAKTVLLAQMYGQSLWKLALKIHKSDAEAQAIRDAMFAAMPRSADFMGRLKAVADKHHKVITMGGRVLPVPVFWNEERQRREVASYKAVNFYCQGSNADFIYYVINEAERRGLGDHILLPMHDEIVCDSEAGPEIQEIMQTPPPFFARWTDHIPTIRTDLQGPFAHWVKC